MFINKHFSVRKISENASLSKWAVIHIKSVKKLELNHVLLLFLADISQISFLLISTQIISVMSLSQWKTDHTDQLTFSWLEIRHVPYCFCLICFSKKVIDIKNSIMLLLKFWYYTSIYGNLKKVTIYGGGWYVSNWR